MDSEFQIALVGLSVAAVIGILAYNKWQDRRDQKHAERSFRRDTRDVLLEPKSDAEPLDRSEPVMMSDELATGSSSDGDSSEPVLRQVSSNPAVPHPAGARHKAPPLPDALDSRVDCIVLVESIELLEVPRLWPVQGEQLAALDKAVRWFGFDDRENSWRELSQHSASAHHWFCVTMQMVDRRGVVEAAQFQAFVNGVQHVADQFLAVPALMPSRVEAMERANGMDQFCASVDIQVGINIVATSQGFPGTKIRALAEAAGMTLGDDGAFHAADEEGRLLFSLSNLEPALFAAAEMRNIRTEGLTLLLDVPLVSDGVGAFARMMRLALQMSGSLNGTVVDDNRRSLSDDDIQTIREQIRQYQNEMVKFNVPAGSSLAKRLFSA